MISPSPSVGQLLPTSFDSDDSKPDDDACVLGVVPEVVPLALRGVAAVGAGLVVCFVSGGLWLAGC